MRRHFRNHSRKASPPPQQTNSYPVITSEHLAAAQAAQSSSTRSPQYSSQPPIAPAYRYPNQGKDTSYSPSPPTPPYTNEPGSPNPPALESSGVAAYDHIWKVGSHSANGPPEGRSTCDADWDDEMDRREARRVGRVASAQEAAVGSHQHGTAQHSERLRGEGQHQQPSPNTPSLRHLHPTTTPTPEGAYPSYTSYQHPYSSDRSTTAVATTSDLRTTQRSSSASKYRRSGTIDSEGSESEVDMGGDRHCAQQSNFTGPNVNSAYSCYTYPPPPPPSTRYHYHSAPLPVPVPIPISSSRSYAPHSNASYLDSHYSRPADHDLRRKPSERNIPIDPALEALASAALDDGERARDDRSVPPPAVHAIPMTMPRRNLVKN